MQPMSIRIAAKGDHIDAREANNSDEKSFGAQMRFDDMLTSCSFLLQSDS